MICNHFVTVHFCEQWLVISLLLCTSVNHDLHHLVTVYYSEQDMSHLAAVYFYKP